MEQKVQPYAFEPENSDVDSLSDNNHDNTDALDTVNDDILGEEHDRIDNTDWCLCQMCTPMSTSFECQCCKDLDKIRNKMTTLGCEDGCISTSDRFRIICLDEDILKITLLLIHDTLVKGPLPQLIPNRQVSWLYYHKSNG